MREIVFDIETKNVFEDVGKNDPTLLDISVVAIHDSETDSYTSFLEEDFSKLWPILEKTDVLIGFNSDHFDIPLLNKYYPGDLTHIKSVDIMKTIKETLGRRLSLNNIASATLGVKKIGHGLDAITWWKEGKIDQIKKYCIEDVRITKKLYDHALTHGELKYRDGPDLFTLKIDTAPWKARESSSMTHTLPF